jgi:hypothetical protein
MSEKEGILRIQSSNRWAVCRPWARPNPDQVRRCVPRRGSRRRLAFAGPAWSTGLARAITASTVTIFATACAPPLVQRIPRPEYVE